MRIRRITWVLAALVAVAAVIVALALSEPSPDVVVAGEGYVVMEEGVPGQEYIETEEGTTIIVREADE